jgi:hypothetical protein
VTTGASQRRRPHQESPSGRWVYFDVTAQAGDNNDHTWNPTVTVSGQPAQAFNKLGSESLIDVVLNGEKVNHVDLAQFTKPNKRPDGSPHKFDFALKDHARKGYIGLQDHGSPCWFKNIKLRPLDPL